MRLKKVFAGALAAAMLVCAVAVPAFAAEEVEQENCLTSSYVQMNIPYADFYKAPVGAEECKAGHRCRQLRHYRYPEGQGIHHHLHRRRCLV